MPSRFSLLIPFLNTLFQAGPEIPITNKFIGVRFSSRSSGRLLVPGESRRVAHAA